MNSQGAMDRSGEHSRPLEVEGDHAEDGYTSTEDAAVYWSDAPPRSDESGVARKRELSSHTPFWSMVTNMGPSPFRVAALIATFFFLISMHASIAALALVVAALCIEGLAFRAPSDDPPVPSQL
ncbi:MAG: hypothetical protein ACOY0T_32210 [Myxococcota bacterium]